MASRVLIPLVTLTSLFLSSLALAKGTVTLDFGVNSEDRLLSLRLGQNGRIYALVDNAESVAKTCSVYALDESGTLIASFGNSGRLRLRNDCARDLAVRPDGSILTAVDGGGSAGVNIIFYDSNGKELSLSATNLSILSGTLVDGYAMALQADGRILVAAQSANRAGLGFRWEVFRWNADGTIKEPAFPVYSGLSGGPSSTADGLAISNGKILISGIFGRSDYETRVHQLLDSGDEDETFGTQGIFTVPGNITPDKHTAGGLAVDPGNGKIYLLAGNSRDLIRLTPTGAPDSSFSSMTTPDGRVPQSIALDSSGRAIVAGVTSEASGNPQAYLTRVTTGGALDSTFGSMGTGLTLAPLTRSLFSPSPNCKVAIQSTTRKLILACTVDNGADAKGYRVSDLTVARFNTDGTLDQTFGAAQKDSDVRPDNFTFATDSVPANTAYVQSNAVTISGIDGPTTVRLQGDNADGSEYSIDCNGKFFDQPLRISTGQKLCVRHHASSTPQGAAQTGLDIGGLYVTYTTQSTTALADVAPDAFTFSSSANVLPGATTYSNEITPSGFDGIAPVSVQNGDYYIGCGNTPNSPATILPGQTVCVAHTGANTAGQSVTTTLTIGGVSGTYTSTAGTPSSGAGGNDNSASGPPDSFAFPSQNGVPLSNWIVSNTVNVTGLGDRLSTVTVVGGEYSIGCTQSFTSAAGSINDGDSLCVRVMSSSIPATTVKMDVRVTAVRGSTESFFGTSFTATTRGTNTSSGSGGGGALGYGFLLALVLLNALKPMRLALRTDR